jgi:ribosomal protein S14
VQTACRLNGAGPQGYYTALVLCRQPADWKELSYRDIAQHCYCADSLQTERSWATGILHSTSTVQTTWILNGAVLQGYYTSLVLCRQPADWKELSYRDIAQHCYCADSLQAERSCATGTFHSIGTVQTACRLNGAGLQGYYTSLVLCRQPADWIELCYRDIAQHQYCAESLQTE